MIWFILDVETQYLYIMNKLQSAIQSSNIVGAFPVGIQIKIQIGQVSELDSNLENTNRSWDFFHEKKRLTLQWFEMINAPCTHLLSSIPIKKSRQLLRYLPVVELENCIILKKVAVIDTVSYM